MKKQLLMFLVALLVSVPTALAYDFSALAPTGQTLYFNITGPNTVEVTHQNDYWPYYSTRTTGNLIIPESVEYENVTYIVTSIGYLAFYLCEELSSVSLPNTVTILDQGAFFGCSGLTTFTIPNSVTIIGDDAFWYCTELTSVSIPNSVTSIGENAFYYCENLTSLTIPSSVSSIGEYAFAYCLRLISMECKAVVPPTVLGSYTFMALNSFQVLIVPCGKMADYQTAAGWNGFVNIQEFCGTHAIYAEGNDIVVDGAAGNTVTLYDNGGNVLTTSTAPSGTPLRFESLAAGTYFVKIGVLPARMKIEIN